MKRLFFLALITLGIALPSYGNNFCVVNSKWASIYERANVTNQQVTQVLFGDPLIIHQKTDKWALVSVPYQKDRKNNSWTTYKGWIELSNTITPLNRELKEYLTNQIILVNNSAGLYIPLYKMQESSNSNTNSDPKPLVSKKGTFIPVNKNKSKGPSFLNIVPEGTILPVMGKDGGLIKVLLPNGEIGLVSEENTRPFKSKKKHADFVEDLIRHAKKYINKAYVWGGTSAFGVDCSGLVYIAARSAGKLVPRDSEPQHIFFHKKTLSDLKRGDLLFYSKDKKTASHVAIYLGKNKLLHASGKRPTEITNISAPQLQGKFLAVAKIIPQQPKKVIKKPVKKIIKKVVVKKIIKKPFKKIVKKIVKKVVKKPGTKKIIRRGAYFYTIHFASFTKDRHVKSLLRRIGKRKTQIYLYNIKTKRGNFIAVHSGIYRSRRNAWWQKRRMRSRREWRKAALRTIRTSIKGRFPRRFYSIQIMALLNSDYAFKKMRALNKVGIKAWIKYERDRFGRPWYSIFYGRFRNKKEARPKLNMLRKTLKIKGKPFIRRLPY